MPSLVIEEDTMIEGNIRVGMSGLDIRGRVVGDVSGEMITIQPSCSADGGSDGNQDRG